MTLLHSCTIQCDVSINIMLICVCVFVFRWPESVVTSGVVEAVCGCLLVKAEMAERDTRGPVQAEHMVLEEFGRCLSQIVEAMFENNAD